MDTVTEQEMNSVKMKARQLDESQRYQFKKETSGQDLKGKKTGITEIPIPNAHPHEMLAVGETLATAYEQIEQGFNHGLVAKLTDEGTSGTYIMRNPEKIPVGIFKPVDEEQYAPNNPRDFQGPFGSATFRAGVLSGEATVREVAAYILDHDHFSSVPATSLVQVSTTMMHGGKDIHFSSATSNSTTAGQQNVIEQVRKLILPELSQTQEEQGKWTHFEYQQSDCDSYSATSTTDATTLSNTQLDCNDQCQIGSFQTFVKNKGPVENFSWDLFEKDEVHKIGILDVRMMNLDRNTCNILVVQPCAGAEKENLRLVPIDHGLSIPDTLSVCSYELAWLAFPQAEEPFSGRSLAYIESLDIEKDLAALEQSLQFRPCCLRNMRISSTLLKIGATEFGLSLAQIGSILCRPDDDDEEPSLLEQAVSDCEKHLVPVKAQSPLFKNLASPSKTDFQSPKQRQTSTMQLHFQGLSEIVIPPQKRERLFSDEVLSPTICEEKDLLMGIDQIQKNKHKQSVEMNLEKIVEEKGPWDVAFFGKLEESLRDVISTFLAKVKT